MKSRWLSVFFYAEQYGARNTAGFRATLSRLCRTGRFNGDARISKSGHYEIRSTATLPPPRRRGRKVGKEQAK